MPLPILPTMVGAATLSNVYQTLGYNWIRNITMWVTTIILIAYLIKIILYFDTCKSEYSNTVPASLYAAFTMILMILGSYYLSYNYLLGKSLWTIGLVLHGIHIIVFTYRNVIKGINKETFVPSWFVTYNGIMVSTVVGKPMNEPFIGKIIVYYGIIIFILILPFMIIRLKKEPIKEALFHTQAILLAPSSLCLVSYLNFISNPNIIIISILYIIILATLLFIIYMLPKFFSYTFTPGFAGLTFPMAIGIVASAKASSYFNNIGHESISYILKEISGIQIYISTTIIAFVLYNFIRILVKSYNKS
ncbi:TDT family transporter [Clostridium sp. AL.422]|nr:MULTISPECIES: TDT family transporter [unclassified Clostridium]MDV4150605.1 TDT family transporter [Clostridium sp. AL.422]